MSRYIYYMYVDISIFCKQLSWVKLCSTKRSVEDLISSTFKCEFIYNWNFFLFFSLLIKVLHMCPYLPLPPHTALNNPLIPWCLCPLVRLICMHTSPLVDLSPLPQPFPTFPLRFDSLINASLSLDLFLFISLCCSLYSINEWDHGIFIFFWLAYFT